MRAKWASVLMFACLSTIIGFATTPGPCSGVCEVFEAIVEKANSEPEVGGDALILFALITEGRPVEIPEAVEARLGLPPIDLLSVPFTRPENRAEACRYIGKLATKDAVFYLELLSTGKFKGDDLYDIWPSCQVALVEARMLNLPSQDERVRYLLEELQTWRDTTSRPLVGSWLVDKLCDSGRRDVAPAVADFIHTWQGRSERAEKAIEFCRQRMEVVASHPDRVQALASALRLNGTESEWNLYNWAIHSLMAIRTPEALAVLERFAKQAEALPKSDASQDFLSRRASYVRSLLSSRRPMKLQ